MYYINLIAESEKREKELQRSEEDRRRLRVGNPPGIDDRLAGLQKTRHEHNKKKKKKRTSSPSEVKSKKAKRKRPRQQPEASPVPSSSSGLGGLAADVVDDEELLIERRSTRNKFAIDDSPSLEEELHPKIVTISSGKLRDDRRPS
ncbi:hypothetical protein Pmar_PMAR017572 [Perkinsus marinus ATCC 50983]|uniref:Uncharacterized protein n=1 Tax=Perkinsus marinus (strain ATCC 50983 / TXsc) TaxID=423536 RepID=C5KVD8_PERM5|nr:hypothetical protein Pmar_PMAR017572 [Perkinsus marinus ATCC 50983]EER11552.1 hypothetical protein Pmar_PMAR017572 [Perkinsus marinus ATCC 50983]|eukprot:XP_002779757.1 hypothetical protein Pmar_PMAR017572 [Perkinsus marinus ATCC 50983]